MKVGDLNSSTMRRAVADIAGRYGIEAVTSYDGPMAPGSVMFRRRTSEPTFDFEVRLCATRQRARIDIEERQLELGAPAAIVDLLAEKIRQQSRLLRGVVMGEWLTDGAVGMPMIEVQAGEEGRTAPALVDALVHAIERLGQDDPTVLERAGVALLAAFARTEKP